jgi:redox-sensing transcriptional repressor
MAVMPEPVIERLLQLTRILEKHPKELLSSAEIEARTGWSSHTIRKDISYLKEELASGAGYRVKDLNAAIHKALGLETERRFCVVGLGRLGSAYLNFPSFGEAGFTLSAGFDASVNRIEILSSPVPLYPSFKMAEVISRFAIELALLCVPAEAAQSTAEKLVAAGIRGIVNFAPVALDVPASIYVRNVHAVDELRAIAARLNATNEDAITADID